MAQTFTATWTGSGGGGGEAPSSVWMEAPDIIAFVVYDPPVLMTPLVAGDYSSKTYGAWSQTLNTVTGQTEWGAPVGAAKDFMRFSDRPNTLPPWDKAKLHNKANYATSLGVGAIASVHYRDEAYCQGWEIANSGGGVNNFPSAQRHYVYIRMNSVVPQNVPITITNTEAGLTPITFTFNDKITRAGGIQINHLGHRPDDALKYGYLAVRLPGGPNNGAVHFAVAPYNFTTFQILDAAKNTVFSGSLVQRCNAAAVTGEGYNSGIDVADLAQSWTVTNITKATLAVVTTSTPHTLIAGDKVRFLGTNGMTQIDSPPAIVAGSLWIGLSVIDPVTSTTFTINLNTSGAGYTAFASTALISEALGGYNNRVFKCFNTNRAGTYVYGLDYSSWTPAPGTYYLHIPGYGISDPLYIASNKWGVAASKLHEGWFTQRHGIAVTNSSGYSRGISLKDGTNGVTNYRSTMPARFSHESAYSITPAGTVALGTQLANFAGNNTSGTSSALILTALTTSGTTATATCSAPHGFTIGAQFAIQVTGCTPAGYNHGIGVLATATTTTQFTYAVASGTAVGTVMGVVRLGWVTNVRHTGHVAHQDAGDNDSPATDHIPIWKFLAMVFRACPKPGRVTPYAVPLSRNVLDSTLFAGTDTMPPMFHELFWNAEAYRLNQMPDGSIWGGHTIAGIRADSTFSSIKSPFPEPVDKYRGNDALGALAGQRCYATIYARDHESTFLYACFAAQLAGIAYDYSLTLLGDTYKASAIAAYDWADGLLRDPATCDAYYKGVLNLKDHAGWTETQYQEMMVRYNGVSGEAWKAKVDAAGALYRLTGGAAYGAMFTDRYVMPPSTLAITNGGAGYAVNDIITVAPATGTVVTGYLTRILVTAVSAGVITTIKLLNPGQYTGALPTNPLSQTVTTGSGTGATFTTVFNFYYAVHGGAVNSGIGAYEYSMGSAPNAVAVDYMQTHQSNPLPLVQLTLPYQALAYAGTGGGTLPNGGIVNVLSHLSEAQRSGVPTARTHDYLKVLQAGCSWILGANLKNKAFVGGVGPRPFVNFLHEDSYDWGLPPPHGVNPCGYWGWATSAVMNNNFAGSLTTAGVGLDNVGQAQTDNVSGQHETGTWKGSNKMFNPWRGSCSYWEWSAEHRAMIYISEFTQRSNLELLGMLMYLHGWDGNA